ncbi:sigma-54-dependent transcriptional regulator [Mesoterricola sediminis]|uniref:Sigma-54-dependent Fis family transcriptional regulator n=1 Tax=Mesoterricola sediminis TaxID=2927980 RepID=A0AA48H164_9BACT|nr:sigma-54 dependent transcriptional regulator [Mesoterricola sediminis]BDU77732.1 sigma-54-dependent Fis family transcriptional regulator [Mesoterricola sediminis]
MANPLRVLVVDDDPGMREGMALSLKRAGFVTEQARSGEDALRLTRPGAFDAVVTDLRMTGMDGLQLTARLKALDSGLPVLLVTAFGSLDTAREAMRLGAFDYLSKPFGPDELVQAVKKAIRSDDRLRAEAPGEAPVILTQDPALAETLALARRAADSKATILIQAESGTGKELLAKLIHASSPRRKAAFVAINCAAIPENLLESELFGYEKGAFTGATSAKPGRFEQAEGGTLVLDEIGELPLALQGKLLRAIQERTVDRLGGSRPIAVDVRLIALTNRDLATEVKEGRFREDLYYRLNVIPLRLPPLRERPADLELLALHFAERYSRENDRPTPALAPSFREALGRHGWPGNIRELENAIQRCVVLNPGDALTGADLAWLLGPEGLEGLPDDAELPPPPVMAAPAAPLPAPPPPPVPAGRDLRVADPHEPLKGVPLGTLVALPLGIPLPELERFWLLSTLWALEGNRTHCSQKLEIALRTVRNKINEYREAGFEIPASGHGRDTD